MSLSKINLVNAAIERWTAARRSDRPHVPSKWMKRAKRDASGRAGACVRRLNEMGR